MSQVHEPLRIAYLLKVFPKISETFIATELAELRRRGIEIRILSLEKPRGNLRHDVVISSGLEQITCYKPGEFLSLIRRFRPQLLHAHFATEATAAAIELATEEIIPFTFTAHGYDIYRKAPSDFRARAMAASAVVTVSRANAKYMAQTFGLPASQMRIIPCGIDMQRFRPLPDRAACQSGDSVAGESHLIVCVARLVTVKNLRLLLESCALLRNKGVKFRCVIIGDGPCRDELENTRKQLNLSGIVEFPGAAEQTEVVNWWQQATLGALTSDNEGMPVSLMEAAACGVPVVATAVGGIPELVQDGTTGLLVRAGDARELANAFERLIVDGNLRTRMRQAARLHAESKFSVTRQVDRLLALWSEILAARKAGPVFVDDPFNAITDSEMPTLVVALDPAKAKPEFKRRLPRLSGENGQLRLKAIRVIRHKPGRRCVVEYDVKVQGPDVVSKTITIIGKARARRFGKEGYRVLEHFWNAGFDGSSADGISVPEPIGVITKFQMWFQRKVAGQTATQLLGQPGGVELARRIAVALHKLHQTRIPTERTHSMTDELRILHECLARVATLKPEWRIRLERILSACDQLGASVPTSQPCGIHRDFYPAQVVIESGHHSNSSRNHSPPRIYLIDFDLYCLGDPALDVGNFTGHMIEQTLRELGDAHGWSKQEEALVETFVELSSETSRFAIEAYTTLTLVRHIYLSTQFPKRQDFTPVLINLCEERLGLR